MPEHTPPAGVTRELFLEWRAAVRGTLNPQRMTNPVWAWLIQSRLGAWQANARFSGDAKNAPGWCFQRYGQSRTELPDGRTVWIAGEHEDYYDPDFFIYNDVAVVAPDGEIEIFGYAPEAFPPTDFHSATLVDGNIVIVGSLGYPSDRRSGSTQVLTLELDRWRVSQVATQGTGPGWIHDHRASLAEDGRALVISGGKIDRCDGTSVVENIDDWRLSLDNWRWERLTERRWPRFEVYRRDNGQNHLWTMRQALWSQSVRWRDDVKKYQQQLQAELGAPPRLDVVPTLYRPAVPHQELPENDQEHNTYRIRIDGVIVKYVEDRYTIQVTAEGELPGDIVEQLRGDLVDKLAILEQAPIEYRVIPPA
jgi:hypothetical protein